MSIRPVDGSSFATVRLFAFAAHTVRPSLVDECAHLVGRAARPYLRHVDGAGDEAPTHDRPASRRRLRREIGRIRDPERVVGEGEVDGALGARGKLGLARVAVDLRDGAVADVPNPDRAVAGRDRTWIVADHDVVDDLVRLRVHDRDGVAYDVNGSGAASRAEEDRGRSERKGCSRNETHGEGPAAPTSTCGGAVDRGRGRSDFRSLAQDRELELAELGRRLDPEVGIESGACVRVDLERVALSAGAVETEHQLAAKALPVGMLVDERLELGNEGRMTSTLKVRIDTGLDCRQSQLVETSDLRLSEGLVGEVGERRPSPQRERLAEGTRGMLCVPATRLTLPFFDETAEAVCVDRVVRDVEAVAPMLEQNRFPLAFDRTQGLPQSRDVRLERVLRGVGRVVGPQLVDQLPNRDNPTGVQGEDCEERSLPSTPDRNGLVGIDDVERAEEPDLHASLLQGRRACLQGILKPKSVACKRAVR